LTAAESEQVFMSDEDRKTCEHSRGPATEADALFDKLERRLKRDMTGHGRTERHRIAQSQHRD
jgi:hypothetical protein